HRQARGVHELDALQVDHDAAAALVCEPDDALAQARRRVDVDITLDAEHRPAAFGSRIHQEVDRDQLRSFDDSAAVAATWPSICGMIWRARNPVMTTLGFPGYRVADRYDSGTGVVAIRPKPDQTDGIRWISRIGSSGRRAVDGGASPFRSFCYCRVGG